MTTWKPRRQVTEREGRSFLVASLAWSGRGRHVLGVWNSAAGKSSATAVTSGHSAAPRELRQQRTQAGKAPPAGLILSEFTSKARGHVKLNQLSGWFPEAGTETCTPGVNTQLPLQRPRANQNHLAKEGARCHVYEVHGEHGFTWSF